MKATSIALGGLAAWVVNADQGGNIPQAVGLDVDGLIAQYLPLILGVVVAFLNESDSIPDWLKQIANIFAKSKGANADFGNKSLELYHKLLDLLEELKEQNASSEQITQVRLALLEQHEKVVGMTSED